MSEGVLVMVREPAQKNTMAAATRGESISPPLRHDVRCNETSWTRGANNY